MMRHFRGWRLENVSTFNEVASSKLLGCEFQSNDTRNLQRDIVGTAVFLGQPDQRLTGIGWRLRTEHILHFSFRQLPP